MTFWGNSSGIRSLLKKAMTKDRIAGKIQRLWTGETLSDFKNTDLADLLAEQDQAAFVARTVRLRNEVAETYALQRDTRYVTRSRKWLYTRGLQRNLDGSYELWRRYVLSTSDVKVTATLPKVDTKVLTKFSFPTLMGDHVKP